MHADSLVDDSIFFNLRFFGESVSTMGEVCPVDPEYPDGGEDDLFLFSKGE